MEISDNSQFTVMPKGTQLAVPNTFASFVSKSEKQPPCVCPLRENAAGVTVHSDTGQDYTHNMLQEISLSK
jgi:hypothetical protein